MNGSFRTLASPVVVIVAAAVFVILATIILTTLNRAHIFPGGVNLTLAICASLLAVTGIMRTFGGSAPAPGVRGNSGWLDSILLPYTAMGISTLLVLLLLRLRWGVPGTEKALRRPRRRIPFENHDRATSETEHKDGSDMSRLAKI